MVSDSKSNDLRWPAWLSAGGLLAASWIAIATLTIQVRPGAEPLAILFPPWWSAHDTFVAAAAAGASIVRIGVIPAIMIVQPASDDGIAKLRAAGAWLTMDPKAVAACFRNSTQDPPKGTVQ